jgi:hypothetical protein
MILNDFSASLIFGRGNELLRGQSPGCFLAVLIHKVIHNFWGQAKKTLSREQVSGFFKKILQQSALTG